MKVFYVLLLTALFPLLSIEIIPDQAKTPILSPAFKDQKTLKLILDNGLQVYLISDPRAEKSAAALMVNAGSWSEPVDQPGLAHFLEHMLFLGTKQHPDEGEFGRFVKQYGGQTNAWTEDLFTTYVFDIDNRGYAEALQRFSEFFKDPLLNPSGVSREIQAITQEFTGNLNKDNSRRWMVLKDISNPDHPISRFNYGNTASLAHANTEILRQWYLDHYSANLMILILESPLSLEELKSLAIENFSTIEDRKFTPFISKSPLFKPESGGVMIYIEPINDKPELLLAWELPQEYASAIDSRPDEILCHILGHEGKESLLQQLKNEHLAESLACGANRWNMDSILFLLQIGLTDEGVKEPYRVIERVFQTINLLKQKQVPDYLFDDIKGMSIVKHQYPKRDEVYEEVQTHAQRLQTEPLATYPEWSHIVQNFQPELIQNLAKELTPKTMYAFLSAKKAQTKANYDRQETWMKVPYTVKAIPDSLIKQWEDAPLNANISLPQNNPFIPQHLAIEKLEKTSPKIIVDDPTGKLYLVSDASYQTPEVAWTFVIRTPAFDYTSPDKIALNDLYIRALKEKLNPFSYPAQVAGLEYTLSQDDFGLGIKINGYSENAHLLLHEILHHLKTVKPTQEQFEVIKKSQQREYLNTLNDSAFERGVEFLREILFLGFVTDAKKEKALQTITFEQFNKHIETIFNQTYVQGLLYGNVDEEEAKLIWRAIADSAMGTPYPKSEQKNKQIAVFTGGPYLIERPIKSKGNGLLLTIEGPKHTFENYAVQEIVSNLISEPFYSELRTQQQTGYVVGNYQQEVERQQLLIFGIESHSHDPRDLLARTELSIERFLLNLNMDSFENTRNSLIHELEKPPETVKKMGEKLFSFGFKYDGDFDWDKKRIEALKKLTYSRFKEVSLENLGKTNPLRLAILIKGKTDDVLNYKRAKGTVWLIEKYRYETRDQINEQMEH